MRMRFLTVASGVALALGGLLPTGCDGVDTGRDTDPEGPPKVERVMVQDIGRVLGRFIAIDILNTNEGKPCDDKNPCRYPAEQCGTIHGLDLGDGKCHDPWSIKEQLPAIGIPEPASTGGVGASGAQIRIVFNKILDPAIETIEVTMAGSKVVKLPEGLLKLQAGGADVKFNAYYDPAGHPTETSHVIFGPFGPAIVIKPTAPLFVNTEYTVTLDTSKVKDRQGNVMAAAGPWKFKTEGLFVMQDWNCPANGTTGICLNVYDGHSNNHPDTNAVENPVEAYRGGPAIVARQTVAPNHFFHFQTNADIGTGAMFDEEGHFLVDEEQKYFAKVTLTKAGGDAVPIMTFLDRGLDPEDCEGGANFRAFNVVPVDEHGERAKLAPGDYTLTIEGFTDLDTGATEIQKMTVKLTVTDQDADPMEDAFAFDNVLLPTECAGATPPPPEDMTPEPAADMGAN